MAKKTAIITGCNRGIGLALTRKFLRSGYQVIGGCRNPDGARDLWEVQADFQQDLTVHELDISSEKSVYKFTGKLPSETNIDVIINNAGILLGSGEGISNLNLDSIEKMFTVNTLGAMRVTKALWPLISNENNLTKLIHITSKMGSIDDNTSGGYYGYRMSKTALNMFNKSLQLESGHFISTAIHPGWVKTSMGGEHALLDVFESTDEIYKLIEGLSEKDNGKFLNYNGENIPW